ncbi:hypothetical protein CRG98_025859 [Punica granatum]|uniref:Retrotransposon gag domain-containing protein n=1 Tax=Punica granatum TaxID=22663 RepID=A0A2I0JBV7_PUNGR|nr:hypothetical protein CRG98_025859 [Punica granatum]
MSAEEYLEWISDVDRFFDYYGIPDDGSRVVRVVYRLRGKASTWWEKLENNRLQDGRNFVCTWRHMKQLLKVRFFPLGYEERLYESEDGCMKSTYPLKHGKTNVFPMTIVDIEEKVQLEEASMKGDKFKEEEVESKNEAAQASQDNNVPVEKDLVINKILRDELISNSEEKVQAELFLDPGQVELREEMVEMLATMSQLRELSHLDSPRRAGNVLPNSFMETARKSVFVVSRWLGSQSN